MCTCVLCRYNTYVAVCLCLFSFLSPHGVLTPVVCYCVCSSLTLSMVCRHHLCKCCEVQILLLSMVERAIERLKGIHTYISKNATLAVAGDCIPTGCSWPLQGLAIPQACSLTQPLKSGRRHWLWFGHKNVLVFQTSAKSSLGNCLVAVWSTSTSLRCSTKILGSRLVIK